MKDGKTRAKDLYDRRISNGLVRLNDWIPVEVRAKLDTMAAKKGRKREEILIELINRA